MKIDKELGKKITYLNNLNFQIPIMLSYFDLTSKVLTHFM